MFVPNFVKRVICPSNFLTYLVSMLTKLPTPSIKQGYNKLK
jgi:hypothetical protein